MKVRERLSQHDEILIGLHARVGEVPLLEDHAHGMVGGLGVEEDRAVRGRDEAHEQEAPVLLDDVPVGVELDVHAAEGAVDRGERRDRRRPHVDPHGHEGVVHEGDHVGIGERSGPEQVAANSAAVVFGPCDHDEEHGLREERRITTRRREVVPPGDLAVTRCRVDRDLFEVTSRRRDHGQGENDREPHGTASLPRLTEHGRCRFHVGFGLPRALLRSDTRKETSYVGSAVLAATGLAYRTRPPCGRGRDFLPSGTRGGREMAGNLYDKAMSQQTLLQKIGSYIPGWGGYQNKETRRDADQMQREFIATRLSGLKMTVKRTVEDLMSGGNYDGLQQYEKLLNKLDKVSNKIKNAAQGYAGMWDSIKIDDAALQKLYQYDLVMVEAAKEVELRTNELRSLSSDPQKAADKAREVAGLVDRVDDYFNERAEVIAQG